MRPFDYERATDTQSAARAAEDGATIIAGAMPPRVMATTARQPPPRSPASPSGPSPSSRHASARLSRWIWSQDI